MGIMKQLQDGEYSPATPELARIQATGAFNGSDFALNAMEVEGKISDLLGLLAVSTASVLSKADDAEAARDFITSLYAAIQMLKQKTANDEEEDDK